MKITVTQESTYTISAGTKAVRGMFHAAEWEGMDKFENSKGEHLILNNGAIVKGSPALMNLLSETPAGFALVPETRLPGGVVVPAFLVAQILSTKSDDGSIAFDRDAKPWTNINFHKTKEVVAVAGYSLITETQWLAIAYNLSQQDCNWTSGKVGEGELFQGIRNDSGAKCASYDPKSKSVNRWMTLSNGEKLCDFNGNVYSWIFDDVQGDERGIVKAKISKDSISRTTALFPSQQKGMGWYPDGDNNWSGYALVRGGCWYSGGCAGVFLLHLDHPDYGDVSIGFRCTKSLG